MRSVGAALERLGLRLLLCAATVACLVLVVPQVWSLLSPFLIALAVAAMLQPLIGFCVQKLHVKRGLAVAFWVTLVCALALVLIYWFVSFAVTQGVNAASNAQSIVNNITGVLQTASDRILSEAQDMPQAVSDTIRESLNSAFKWLGDQATILAGDIVAWTFNFAASLPYVFVYANFLILGLFFISSRYDEIRGSYRRNRQRGDDASQGVALLRKSAGKGIIGYVRVQLLFAMMVFVVSWVYLQALGFQYAVLIAILGALLELVPLFGCGALYIPWSIICFIVGSTREGWLVLGLYLVYSLSRRLLEPKILSSNIGISPLLSLVGMFVGLRIGGVVGLIGGPMMMVLLVSAVRARLFDGVVADLQCVAGCLRRRWTRDTEK